MGNIFDRNVHPLYAVMAFISALIVSLLLTSGTYNRKGIDKNHKLIFIWVIFFCIQDGIWGLYASHVFFSNAILFFVSNIFHLSAIFSAFAWTVYFLSRITISKSRIRLYISISAIFLLIQICLIIANVSSRFMFYVDDNGWYQTTDYRSIMFYLQFATYIFIGIVSLLRAAREQQNNNQSLLAVFFVNLSPLLFGVFQLIYPDAPADSIGFAIGCVIIELFLSKEYEDQVYTLEQMQELLQDNISQITRQNELIEDYAKELKENSDQLSNYKRAVLSDALISLEVNLSKDELYYGVWKSEDGKEVPLEDIIGFRVPCSYDEYLTEWNSRFVSEGFNTDYSQKSSVKNLLDSFDKGLTDVTFDYHAKTISGKSAWLRRSINMIRNQAGDVIAFTSVKDISLLVNQAKREEAYIRALSMEYDGIAVISIKDGRYSDYLTLQKQNGSPYTSSISNLNAGTFDLDRELSAAAQSVHPDDRDRFINETRKEAIFDSFAENRTHFVNYRLMTGEDSFIYYQSSFIPLRDDSCELIGMILCGRNVDSEIRKEFNDRQELEAARIAAESANRSKSSFLFNMSHDIRTPMNAIIGFTDIAIKHIDDKDRVLEALEKVKLSSSNLLMLINDVLDMSRVESGTIKIQEESVNIDDARDNLFNILNGNAEEKNIAFSSTIDASVKHRWIYVDRLCMMRVLTNIVSNSIKYTLSGGKVNLHLEELPCQKDGYAHYRYTVSDTGIGMSKEFLSHVFEPFSRAETATKSGITGTGLGMSITKSLVEMMGGSISIDSELGVGTTVTLEFENRISDSTDSHSVVSETVSFNLEGKRILLVDDNELNREIAADILEEEGLIIDTAEDGDIAVEKMKNAHPGQYDMILMDVQMPHMNGYDATRAIRMLPDEYASQIPIIAMTANAFDEDRQNAFNAGMNGHIAKPIDIPKLLSTLSEALN